MCCHPQLYGARPGTQVFIHARQVHYQLSYISSLQDLDSSELQFIFPQYHPTPFHFSMQEYIEWIFFPVFELFAQEKPAELIRKHKVTLRFPTDGLLSTLPLFLSGALSTDLSHSSHPYHSVLSPSTDLRPSLVQSES